MNNHSDTTILIVDDMPQNIELVFNVLMLSPVSWQMQPEGGWYHEA